MSTAHSHPTCFQKGHKDSGDLAACKQVCLLDDSALPLRESNGLLILTTPENEASIDDSIVIATAFELERSIASTANFDHGPQPWPINYLSYVRYLDTMVRNGMHGFHTILRLTNRLDLYLREHNLVAAYEAGTLDPRTLSSKPKAKITAVDCLRLTSTRKVTWALSFPILGQLKSIAIPTSDVRPYLAVADRLSSLATVIFYLDDLCDLNVRFMENVSQNNAIDTARHVEMMAALKRKRRQDLELAVEFVKALATLHRGVLRQVSCPDNWWSWSSQSQQCPPDILDRMIACLPALVDPTELNDKNWKQFTANIESVNLDHVESIQLWENFSKDSFDRALATPFLHRCRSLRSYKMPSFGPDSFKWAVTHKTAIPTLPDDSSYTANVDPLTFLRSQPPPPPPPLILPPLQHVRITASRGPFEGELDDIAKGFGKTLRTLEIYSDNRKTQPGVFTITTVVSVGHGWNLPRLAKLTVVTNLEQIDFDPNFLCSCPQLESLYIEDRLRIYDLRQIRRRVQKPARLPNMKHIVLLGSGALAFQPATLGSTPELRILILSAEGHFDRSIVPSPDWERPANDTNDIDEDDTDEDNIDDHYDSSNNAGTSLSPRHGFNWTWDWHLPQLTVLALSFEYAPKFRFQMLAGTPNLYELSLSLYTPYYNDRRELTDADFIIGSAPSCFSLSSLASSLDDEDGNNFDHDQELRLEDQELVVLETILTFLHTFKHVPIRIGQPPRAEWLVRPVHPTDGIPINPRSLQSSRIGQMETEDHRRRNMSTTEISEHPISRNDRKKAVEKLSGQIKEFVGKYKLEQELEKILTRLRDYKCKEQEAGRTMKEFRAMNPKRVVVPSLKKFEMNGRWKMTDKVMETMLGTVFRNVETIAACQWDGYSLAAFVRITQTMMPSLIRVKLSDMVDVPGLSPEFALELVPRAHRPLFDVDARTRIEYYFKDHGPYMRKGK
ncbi:hypothetical protein BG004_005296 [Podila humilis]|nr:hypothetical protein BG004_005296 [Podila humilis]